MSDILLPHDAALERLKALHPKKIDLSLGRMARLCAALGAPEQHLAPVVHMAGTNGKGSTLAFLRAMAEAQGLKPHVFISPHLVRFAERIRLAGRLISEDGLANLLARVEAVNAEAPITFFEVTAAAALLAFAQTPADLCLVEVGLGGRFDATNILPVPAIAAIAPVDLDHKEFLGDDLATIAREKAGILKSGGLGVIGRQSSVALGVIEAEAERVGARLIVMGRDFDAWAERGRMVFQDERGLMDLPLPSLPGVHQIDNAGLALAIARALPSPQIGETAQAQGIATASWPARMQRLTKGPLGVLAAQRGADLWLDGGHNPHAARALAETLQVAADGRPLVVILGLLANKEAKGVLAPLIALNPRLILTHFRAEAAARPEDLAELAQSLGLAPEMSASVSEAVQMACQGGGPPPKILICGSLYLAGEVLNLSRETWPD